MTSADPWARANELWAKSRASDDALKVAMQSGAPEARVAALHDAWKAAHDAWFAEAGRAAASLRPPEAARDAADGAIDDLLEQMDSLTDM